MKTLTHNRRLFLRRPDRMPLCLLLSLLLNALLMLQLAMNRGAA